MTFLSRAGRLTNGEVMGKIKQVTIDDLAIADAKRLAERFGAHGAIVLVIDGSHRVSGASWGAARGECRKFGGVLDTIMAALTTF